MASILARIDLISAIFWDRNYQKLKEITAGAMLGRAPDYESVATAANLFGDRNYQKLKEIMAGAMWVPRFLFFLFVGFAIRRACADVGQGAGLQIRRNRNHRRVPLKK
ncbi:MAG: hypothetical protein J6M25_06185 [Prevotella sp.]|nr:hypothetical protein [Prevotella sp.]